jgi:hypothetical protein
MAFRCAVCECAIWGKMRRQSGDHWDWEARNKFFQTTVLQRQHCTGVQLLRGPNRKIWTRLYIELINLDFLIVIPSEPYARTVLKLIKNRGIVVLLVLFCVRMISDT